VLFDGFIGAAKPPFGSAVVMKSFSKLSKNEAVPGKLIRSQGKRAIGLLD
jgi:hypothetical protein